MDVISLFLPLWIVISLLVLIFLIYGIYFYILDKRYRLPPGPPPLPFIGNALHLSNRQRPWISFYDLWKEYGSIATFYVGQYRMIILNDSDVINEAIVNQGRVFSDRPLHMLPGFEDFPTGILFSNGEEWKSRRRFCMKALRDFGMGKLAISEKIHDEANYFLAEVEELTCRPFNPHRLLTHTVSNIISRFVFGKRFEYSDTRFIVFLDQLQKVAKRSFSQQITHFAFPFLRNYVINVQAVEGLKLHKLIGELVEESIRDHRTDFNKENIRDFPDLFIQAEFTNEAIDFDVFIRIMTDLFAAGTETTATALNWSLLYLSTYPDLQRRCHDAIDRHIDTDRMPTSTDRPKLVYIDAIMCEVLRHSTIVPLALFHCNMNEKATVSGYDIPEGSIVVYNIWGLHHDQLYWTNPDKFNPDRWIDSSGKLKTHSSHFLPFGAGPRVCIGELLARDEYFIFLVSLLQRFTFALADAKVSLENGTGGITYAPPKYKLIATKR